jgi:pyruvate kinase
VANAILDGTDCVMLSEETAMGQFPDDAVAMMTHIAEATEPDCCAGDIVETLRSAKRKRTITIDDLISYSFFQSVDILKPVAVITPTMSGATSRRLSRFRLPVWIVGVSRNESTCQNLQFSYGVHPVYQQKRPENWEQYARDWLTRHDVTGELALLTRGTTSASGSGGTNQLEIINLAYPPDGPPIW